MDFFIRLPEKERNFKWIDMIDSPSSGPTNGHAHEPVWDWVHSRGLSHQTQQTTSEKNNK